MSQKKVFTKQCFFNLYSTFTLNRRRSLKILTNVGFKKIKVCKIVKLNIPCSKYLKVRYICNLYATYFVNMY